MFVIKWRPTSTKASQPFDISPNLKYNKEKEKVTTMKDIIIDFITALLSIIIFFIALIAVFAALPLCLIALPFAALFALLFGDDDDDYN